MKNTSDVFMFYAVLILPTVTSLILLIEGLIKVFSGRKIGLVSLFFSIVFLATTVIAYLVLSNVYSQ